MVLLPTEPAAPIDVAFAFVFAFGVEGGLGAFPLGCSLLEELLFLLLPPLGPFRLLLCILLLHTACAKAEILLRFARFVVEQNNFSA